MKKILQLISLILITLSFGFKNKINTEVNKELLCKQWETDARDDVNSKIIITFNPNNTYSHEYSTKGIPKKESIFMTGKWSIGKDKKIHIEFNKSPVIDIFEIVSMKENELIMSTAVGVKKFRKIK
ncbi:MAG TPA: lipocalin family protein [Candidatus Paceibacterota bacterium]|nr:lipocalin family protein [Candidatus Paceibacterota bacterium]